MKSKQFNYLCIFTSIIPPYAKGEIKFLELNDKKAIDKGLTQTLSFCIISINKVININTGQNIVIYHNDKYNCKHLKNEYSSKKQY